MVREARATLGGHRALRDAARTRNHGRMVDDDAERAVTELRGPSLSSSCRSDTGIVDPDAAVVV